MGCCQSSDSAASSSQKQQQQSDEKSNVTPTAVSNKNLKQMNKQRGVMNLVHPTSATLATEETPFGEIISKKDKNCDTPLKQGNDNGVGEIDHSPEMNQQSSPQLTMENFHSPNHAMDSPPSFMKKPKVYLKPLPLDKLKQSGDSAQQQQFITLQPLKPLPPIIPKNQIQNGDFQAPDFVPKFGLNIHDIDHNQPVHHSQVVEESESELQDSDDDHLNQQVSAVDNNQSAIFSSKPLKLLQPPDSERARGNVKSAETYVNGLLNKIWDSQDNTPNASQFAAHIKQNPIIQSFDGDEVNFGGLSQRRIQNKLVSFKMSEMEQEQLQQALKRKATPREGGTQREQPHTDEFNSGHNNAEDINNYDDHVQSHEPVRLLRANNIEGVLLSPEGLLSDKTASHRPHRMNLADTEQFSPEFPMTRYTQNPNHRLQGHEDGEGDLTMITDRHVRMMDVGITREAQGRLVLEDSFNNGVSMHQPAPVWDSFIPLSHRQENNLINGDSKQAAPLSHRQESTSKNNPSMKGQQQQLHPSGSVKHDFSSQRAGMDDGQDFFLAAGEEELNSFISHGSKHDSVAQRI